MAQEAEVGEVRETRKKPKSLRFAILLGFNGKGYYGMQVGFTLVVIICTMCLINLI